MTKKKNPLVFLDVSVDGDPVEKMVFELFVDVAPQAAENFRALCTGEKGVGQKYGKPLHYKGSFFHRIIKGSMAQGGDFVKRDGSCGESIYGANFPDESPRLKHDVPGLLSMSVADRDTFGSQFIITFDANQHLDRKNVVFGKLVSGLEVLKKMENMGDDVEHRNALIKITNCGEFHEGNNLGLTPVDDLKKLKLKNGKVTSPDTNSHDVKRKKKHKKSLKDRRKKRRRYYSSESDSTTDTDIESYESDSDSESDSSSSSEDTSSSDDWRRKRKRFSKKDKYKRGKRRDKRSDRKRKKRYRKSKRKSKRDLDSSTDTESKKIMEGSLDDNGADIQGPELKPTKGGHQSSLADGLNGASVHVQNDEMTDTVEKEEGEFPMENGMQRINGTTTEARSDASADKKQPDVVDDRPGKSRSRSMSPKRTMSISMSISPRRCLSKSPIVSPKRNISRSPSVSNPKQVPARSVSRSRSPVRSGSSASPAPPPARRVSRRGTNISLSPARGRSRSISRSPSRSPTPRTSSRKSPSRSPARPLRRSVSRSPVRSSRRSISRSSGRPLSRKSVSRSPAMAPSRNNRRSYSPASPTRRARSPPDRRRSLSKSASEEGSPKRVRRGRGFSQRYSYARRYRTPSPDRSPVRSYRYGGRNDRDRPYRRYVDRSPRRYRSPPGRRTPPRYNPRRSRTRSPSVSRSPNHRRRRHSPSRSPIETSRYRPSPKRKSPSNSQSESRSSLDSQSPKPQSKVKSRSSSGSRSPLGKKGLVAYDDGSPDSGR